MSLTNNTKPKKEKIFTGYQVFMIAVLAILQFTVILDFMVLSPLGAILMDELSVTTSQFGLVVSAYAFSAGASGLLTAGFADKFDRKKLLMFFYTGFILATAACALAPTYETLLIARIATGLFGGVIGSVSFAIISDLFKMEVRGRVMGYVQMAFAASQILGLPIGLQLATAFNWHATFWMIAGVGAVVGVIIAVYMKPVNGHLLIKSDKNPFQHLAHTVSNRTYLRAFLGTTLLATGGFMMMPFGSAFSMHNLGLDMTQINIMYTVTGVFSIFFGPIVGKLSDKVGKYKIFCFGTGLGIIMVAIYTHLGITPLWQVIALNVILFLGITSRMISASSLMSAVPEAKDRGAFMSINSSVQQIAGGIAAAIGGLIVFQPDKNSKLEHYDTLGYVVIGSMLVAVVLMYFVNRYVQEKLRKAAVAPVSDEKIVEVHNQALVAE